MQSETRVIEGVGSERGGDGGLGDICRVKGYLVVPLSKIQFREDSGAAKERSDVLDVG